MTGVQTCALPISGVPGIVNKVDSVVKPTDEIQEIPEPPETEIEKPIIPKPVFKPKMKPIIPSKKEDDSV